MKKIDINQEGMKIPKIEYDVYCKSTEGKLEKLNLSLCENAKIYILIPKEININNDILNSRSGYYNDICYTTTSDSGTDIPLNDRKNEYVNNTVCQDDCDFSDYDKNTQKVNCSCKAKESSSNYANMTINKSNLLKDFINIKTFANINILVCFQKLFGESGIIYNVGCYIVLFVILLHIIFIFIFYKNQLGIIQNKIKDIIFGIINNKLLNYEKEIKSIKNKTLNTKTNKKDNESKKSKNKIKKDYGVDNKKVTNHKNDNKILLLNENNDKNKKSQKKKNKNNFIEFNLTNNIIDNNLYYERKRNKKNRKNSFNQKESQKNIITNIGEINIQKTIKKIKKIMEYTDDEINDLSYNLALQHDKRNYCQYYISLLKTKHNFIFSFFYNNDYNSKILKIDIFFIDFVINYAINGLFFDDDAMHTIYINKGSFNLKDQLPQTIYSSLISMIFNGILTLLALSNESIIDFKQLKTVNKINQRKIKMEKILKIKFILYFIISFIFLLFFWYYISMFGVIYRNTQYYLLKDTFISFVLSLIYPFGIYLLPGIFRIYSLSNKKKKNRECCYQFSKILQIF